MKLSLMKNMFGIDAMKKFTKVISPLPGLLYFLSHSIPLAMPMAEKSRPIGACSYAFPTKRHASKTLNILGAFFFFVCIAFTNVLIAQTAPLPYAKEIAAFKKQDSVSFPASGQTLLIGSSSFTKWKDLQQYFPGYPILNRAFGGSSLSDVIRYREAVIFPYNPKQIIIYCGENDFTGSDTVTVSTVVQHFRELFGYIRSQYPKIPVVYISMKPSPSRRHLLPKYIAANNDIRNFLASKKRTTFIDVYQSMLAANGEPLPQLFLSDSLHMNATGYAIWAQQLKPHLKK
jgi:lysophospholipase L1-like esterase